MVAAVLVAASAAGSALVGWATHRAATACMLTTGHAARLLHTRRAAVAAATLAGVLGGLLAWRIGADLVLVAVCWIAGLAPTLTAIDLLERRLPDALTLGSYPVLLALLSAAAVVDGRPGALVRAVITMAAVVGFFAAVAAVSGGVGLGDVKLSGALGLVLGDRGAATAVAGIALGLLCGALAGAAVVVSLRGGWRTRVSFGPALLVGAVAALLL